MIPLLGATKPSQMTTNIECLNYSLNEEQLSRLNDCSQIEMGFPHEFLESEQIQDIVFGGTYNQIDNHHLR